MIVTNPPKRQRTVTALLRDRGTTGAMVVTLKIARNRAERRSGLLMTGKADDDFLEIADRLDDRCLRMARLLQTLWFPDKPRRSDAAEEAR